MKYRILGNTGLRISAAGLGCGGASKLGLANGASHSEVMVLIRHCIDLGVNFIDTAPAYGTEPAVGEATSAYGREELVIATKAHVRRKNTRRSAQEIAIDIDQSLRTLRTDYIDLLQLHGLLPDDYDYAISNVLPMLERLREDGKIRFVGVTESPSRDFDTRTARAAIEGGKFDTCMLGVSILNQRGARTVLPRAVQSNFGIIAMMAVRRALANAETLMREVHKPAAASQLPSALLDKAALMQVLLGETGCKTLSEAAYRFVASLPGISTVLFGTSKGAHATRNIADITKPPLSDEAMKALEIAFGDLSGVGLNTHQPRLWWRRLLGLPPKLL